MAGRRGRLLLYGFIVLCLAGAGGLIYFAGGESLPFDLPFSVSSLPALFTGEQGDTTPPSDLTEEPLSLDALLEGAELELEEQPSIAIGTSERTGQWDPLGESAVQEVPAPETNDEIATYEAQRLRYRAAMSLYDAGQDHSSRVEFEEIIGIDPTSPYARYSYIMMGNLSDAAQNYEAAAAYYNKALQLDPNDVIALHNRGLTFLHEGRGREALADLQKAAELAPQNSRVLQNLGNAYYAVGVYTAAIESYTRSIEIDRNNAGAYYNRGLASLREGDLFAASESFAMAGQLGGNDLAVSAYTILGNIQDERGLFNEAVDHYRKALQLQPNRALLHYNLAVALQHAGKIDEAAESYQSALRLDSTMPRAWFNLGGLRYSMGLYDPAVEAYRKGLQLDPADPVANYVLGFLLQRQGDNTSARYYYEQVFRMAPQSREAQLAHNNLGLIFEAEGRYDDAAAQYRAAGEENALALYNLGQVLTKKGEFSGAVEAYQASIRVEPALLTLRALGDLLFDLGLYDEALTSYERAIHLGSAPAGVYLRAGYIYARKERIPEAETAYQQGIDRNPEMATRIELLNNLGALWDRQGKFEEALDAFGRVLRLDAQNATAFYNRGIVFLHKGDYPRAIEALQASLRIDPNNAAAHTNLGNIYRERGLLEEAIHQYERAIAIDASNVDAQFYLSQMRQRN